MTRRLSPMNACLVSHILRLGVLASLLFSAAVQSAMPGGAPASDQRMDTVLPEVRLLFQQGRFERGIEKLAPFIEKARRERKVGLEAEARLLLARGYEALGRHTAARRVLEEVLALKDLERSRELSIQIYDLLALAYNGMGQADSAQQTLERGLELAKAPQESPLLGVLLNDLGTLQADAGDFDSAIHSFGECSRLARKTGLRELESAARINWARTQIYRGQNDGLDSHLAETLRLVKEMPMSHQQALDFLSIGSHYWLAQWRFGLPAEWRKQSYEAYRAGLEIARSIGDDRLVAHALGSIGRLYGDEGRYDEALRYTRQAAFVAQEADAADILYLWQWQSARMMRSQGNQAQAIEGYRHAIQTMSRVRLDLTRSGIPFQTLVGSIFRELADLLLRRASATTDKQAAQRDLIEVRATLEELRQAEVAEYFRDDCVVQAQGATQLDKVSKDAAVIYPVLLSDRTELLVSLPGGLEQFSVAVGLPELSAAIRDFRQSIEVFDAANGFLPHSRRLYDWLIGPMEDRLRQASTKTLVIIPDGPLRTIPLSALHDGKSFLIEKYAVVTTPGLMLTSSGPASRAQVQALASGLTQSVQGFSALPNVSAELASIATVFPTTRLQDSGFQKASVEREVAGGQYSIVHFATHGHFDSDHSRSFLVTFDGQITMDDLQGTVGQRRYREEPVELLVLSACQTAAGDDRAALGLAGVGLKAGAKSVVASLWSISDESTALLIAELYRQLKDAGSTKAQALRAAQLSLLGQERFHHPYFWAPFLLIGNWL